MAASKGHGAVSVSGVDVCARLYEEDGHVLDAEEGSPFQRRAFEFVQCLYIDVCTVVEEELYDLPVVLKDCDVEG